MDFTIKWLYKETSNILTDKYFLILLIPAIIFILLINSIGSSKDTLDIGGKFFGVYLVSWFGSFSKKDKRMYLLKFSTLFLGLLSIIGIISYITTLII